MFDASTVDYAREILVDTKNHDAKTVAELLAFMQKYRLQFASAERHPATRELYLKLFESMREQADNLEIGESAGPEVADTKPQPKETSTWGSPARVGAKWVGSGASSSGYSQKQDWTIVARTGNKFTMRERNHKSNNVYDFECEFTGPNEYQLIRIINVKTKAASGAGSTGSGTIDGDNFTFRLNWTAKNTIWNSSGKLSR